MKVMERNVMRLVAVQQLRAAYGIKTKNWNKNKAASCKLAASSSTKVFGVPLESLPYYNMECGSVPSFLVDACMKLLAHVDTEGLFRKSGSVVRLKALRAKLDLGEECLSTALPCDVAGLVKQFFRELPEPVLLTDLQEAFLKAQQLPTEEERTSATMLLSCVLPDKNLSVLRYFFDFLYNVSQRSAENKMDSNNLSVILAPNLLHSGDGTEKMNANTEKRLKLQAAIVHCFIENAHSFGVLPQFLLEKVPAMMGCESPTHHELEELDLNSGMKRKPRRSLGAYSASGVLDTSQNILSSAGRSRRQSATSARRKSRRLSNRHAVNRVESGKAGCFSPKTSKKEAPRKSLRLRFSLGKSSKDAGSESIGWRLATQESTTSFRFTKETEFSPTVLPRKTESTSSKYISKSEDNLLTPQCDLSAHRTSWSGETPVGAQAFSGESFTDTPMNMCLKSNYVSEPTIVISKPPAVSSLPLKLCCASSAESLESERSINEAQTQTGPTLLRIKKAFTESGSDLQAVVQDSCSSTEANITKPSDSIPVVPPESPPVTVLSVDAEASRFPAQQSLLPNEQNVTFGQIEIAALSPLHIDSVVFESDVYCSPVTKNNKDSLCAAATSSHHGSMVEQSDTEAEQVNCSRLIDALDIQSPARFKLGVSSGLQSTPYRLGLEHRDELCTPEVSTVHETEAETGTKVQNQHPLSPHRQETEKRRVADHIQHFNKLTLNSPRGSRSQHIRSPLKFQRTPVRQAVRRINSVLGDSRRPTRNTEFPKNQSQVAKAVSLESGLSPHPHQREPQVGLSSSRCPMKKPPPVPPKKPSTLARKAKACALGDVTNKAQPKIKVDCSVSETSGAQKALIQQVAEKEMNHYRGSPRNPLNQARLLSATKPVDL
ncbi:rho GTPase-activating protein 11A isoform X3 [Stegastes partitus]|uniref:Rho GTPase-activating protein 11A isoform X3 n=1 Tax=Stegastes partitus TaxID=144197 RepID=A0A9Y4N471_9TELE|nr:PREDICTED: rho GTPase-activating protein 11A-like isoform X3 [Stegastes partitus]